MKIQCITEARENDGYQGSPTPDVDDRVRVMNPRIEAYGQRGDVASCRNGFCVVFFDDGTTASFHTSDLLVVG